MQRKTIVGWFRLIFFAGFVCVLPHHAGAQEAVITGTVTDPQGSVLPGVTVVAFHDSMGSTYSAITNQRGAFRIPVPAGRLHIGATSGGFSATSADVELLIGRTALVNLRLVPHDQPAEDAPVIGIASSTLAGNIDPRQMQELPINGRNWMNLTMLTPGSRLNAVTDTPVAAMSPTATFQLNVDGQEITQTLSYQGGLGQPRFSREAIAEFEFVSRFDASQGRASSSQVNVITRSGTNTPSGATSLYMRSDRLNAADPVTRTVLPYSNQQVTANAGGPVRRDWVHLFGSYEYEREPQTFVYATSYPSFNRAVTGTRREDKALVRMDVQLSSQTHASTRGDLYRQWQPYDPATTGGSTRTPASANSVDVWHDSIGATLTHIMRSGALDEITVGHTSFRRDAVPLVRNSNVLPGMVAGRGAPIIMMQGLTVGQVVASPVNQLDAGWSARDDLLWSFSARGRHDMKIGGEYVAHLHAATNCGACSGTFDALGGAIPINIETLFPDITDASTWNLAPLSPIIRSYQRPIFSDVARWSRPAGGSGFRDYAPRHQYAGWAQDEWRMTSRLTLSPGVRYDLDVGAFANWVASPPFFEAGRSNDINNVAPRIGFAFVLTNSTVLRGGYGIYFASVAGGPALNTIRYGQRVQPLILNDRRSDFAVNPFNGPAPSFEQASNLLCSVSSSSACLRPSMDNQVDPDLVMPYAHQASIGFQRELGDQLFVEADYAFSADRATWLQSRNLNLSYDPATGANYPITDITKRPYPNFGTVFNDRPLGRTKYHSLQITFTKRLSRRWQAAGTYAVDGLWNFDALPLTAGCAYPVTLNAAGQPVCDVPITLAPDVSENRYYLTGAQWQRLTMNGIWQARYGFQISGTYLYGDQGKGTPTSGLDVRQTGLAGGRLRRDGTVIARNSFDLPSIHRIDLRILRGFALGRWRLNGIVEAYNVLNRANYGTIVLNESNSSFGKPSTNTNLAYAPRMVQIGLQATF